MSIAPTAKKFASMLAKAWMLLFLFIVVYSDFGMKDLVERSDFLSCMWTGGKLVASGRWNDLYTPYGMVSFAGAPCDLSAHQFLPHLPPNLIAEFNYCPLVAWFLSAFSVAPPNIALLVWQLLSFGALIAAVVLLIGAADQRVNAFSFALCLLPTAMAVWIGQTDIVLGVFFYALGFWLLMRERDQRSFSVAHFASGVCFAVACLKPQFIIAPGLIGLVMLSQRRWAFVAGCIVGGGILIAANIAVSSMELMRHWLYAVQLCERIFTDPNAGLQKHLIVSWPGMLLLSGKAAAANLKALVYTSSAIFAGAAVASCVRFANGKELRQWVPPTLACGIMVMPFVIPNFVLYDYSMFIIAGLALLQPEFRKACDLNVTRCIVACAIAIDVYSTIMLTNKHLVHPAMLLVVLVCVLASILYSLWTRKTVQAVLIEPA